MTNVPEKDPLESATAMEVQAQQLEARAMQLRSSARQLRETARQAASQESRMARAREQQRKAKQVAAIQQLSIQQNSAPEPPPSATAQVFSFFTASPLFRGATVLLVRLAMLAILVGGFIFAYQKITDNRTQGRQDESSNSVFASFASLEDLSLIHI